MEGLFSLLNAFGDLLAPLLRFAVWIFPLKVAWLHDGQRGVLCTCGKVRPWRRAERGPGVTVYGPCEEIHVVQAVNCYLDLAEQTLTTKDRRVAIGNGALIYSVFNVRQADLETNNHPGVITAEAMDVLRQWAQDETLVGLLDSEQITKAVAGRINRRIARIGCRVDRVLLADLRPHDVQMGCDALHNAARTIAGRDEEPDTVLEPT
jgi:hypothetical protein